MTSLLIELQKYFEWNQDPNNNEYVNAKIIVFKLNEIGENKPFFLCGYQLIINYRPYYAWAYCPKFLKIWSSAKYAKKIY